jgi:tRNA-dihydrouridine synthase B
MKKFSYMLAPLEDYSDGALRTLCYRYGADLTFTEMIMVNPLSQGNKNTWSRIEFKDNTPVIIQLMGGNEVRLKKFLKMFKPHKGFQGFNFNMGCPNPHIINEGLGCAMIKRVGKTKKLIKTINNYGYKCSIKMRLGMNNFEKEKKVYLNLINDTNPDFFIVHAREGSQKYDEEPDYSVYDECVKTGKNIVANGSINTKEQVSEFKKIGLKGVMIGRAAINNPAIFNQLKGLKTPSKLQIKKEYLELANKFESPNRYRKNFLKHFGE